jgi:apolipoprotein N-acyltransferase
MGFWRGLLEPDRYVALFAGGLPVLAFPAPNLEFVAWFGLLPGLFVIRAAPTGREAAVRGWWFGSGYLLFSLYWLGPNLGPALALVVIVLGAPWAGVGYATWRLLRGQPKPDGGEPLHLLDVPGPGTGQALAALVVLPSSWVVIDWLRSWQGIGGPWAVFGASQWQHPVVLALAAVGGVWLISFTLVAANTGIMIALISARWPGRVLGLAGAVLAIAAGPAAFAVTAGEYAAPAAQHLTLDLVQPGLRDGPTARLAAETRLTLGLRGSVLPGSVPSGSVPSGSVPPGGGARRPALIVWGESSVGYDLYTDHRVLGQLTTLSRTVGTPLLVSQDALNPSGAKSKVAVLIGSRGIEGTYVKTRLVPFGEYIPFRSMLGWLSQISRAAPTNMITGNGAHVLHAALPGGRRLTFGVLICFESSFPDMSAVDANHGAQVLIYQTSDSTFQSSWALPQHASLAAIRAAESGRPTVQAALTGDSAAFDSRGRLLAWLGATGRGVLRITLPLPASPVRTPFSRFGDYVPWFAIAVVVVSVLAAAEVVGRVRRLMPD